MLQQEAGSLLCFYMHIQILHTPQDGGVQNFFFNEDLIIQIKLYFNTNISEMRIFEGKLGTNTKIQLRKG